MGKYFEPMRDLRGDDSPQPKPRVFKTYARLLRYVRPHWKRLAFALALTIALSFTAVLPQQLFGVVVDSFREGGTPYSPFSE